MSELGNPAGWRPAARALPGRERGELKHLSTRRRRKKVSIPRVAASERGLGPNRCAFGRAGVVGPACVAVAGPTGGAWKGAAQRVTPPYGKALAAAWPVPE